MPRSLWFKVIVLLAAFWAPLSQADTGWQPIQETIRKSEKDTCRFNLSMQHPFQLSLSVF